jgi:hypothetical protein
MPSSSSTPDVTLEGTCTVCGLPRVECSARLRDERIALSETAPTVQPSATAPRINTVPLIKRLREQRDQLADVLRWLDRRGGLGFDAHERISKALEGVPTHEQQLRNIAEGIGMTYEDLLAACANLPAASDSTGIQK